MICNIILNLTTITPKPKYHLNLYMHMDPKVRPRNGFVDEEQGYCLDTLSGLHIHLHSLRTRGWMSCPY